MNLASDFGERALFAFENAMHPSFNITLGTNRLCFNRVENRPIFSAIFRHVDYLGRKGCWRTALEFQKLLFGLNLTDPLCSLFTIDFLALKAGDYKWYTEFWIEFKDKQSLNLLPNAVYSLAMCVWEQETLTNLPHDKSNALLESAIFKFPSVVVALLSKMEVSEDFMSHDFFKRPVSNSYDSLATMLLIQDLYVETTHTLWKVPFLLSWLKKIALELSETVTSNSFDMIHNQKLVENYETETIEIQIQRRDEKYGKFGSIPLNIQRMIFVADLQSFIPRLPPTETTIMSYDPFPPLDAIPSFYDAQRHAILHPPGSTVAPDATALGAFLQSLLPWLHVADAPPVVGGEGTEVIREREVGIVQGLLRQIENGPIPDGVREALRQIIAPFLGEAPAEGEVTSDSDESIE